MATQANGTLLFPEAKPRSIVRPLPPGGTEGAGGTDHGSAGMARTVLFGIDTDWYNAYWYGERSDTRQRLRGKLVRGLRDATGAAWAGLAVWSAHKTFLGRFKLSSAWR
jgi:hypothetical protein